MRKLDSVEADEAERVVHIGRQPGALSEQVEHAELAGDPGVLELELGIEIDHPVVPAEFLAIDHDAYGRREKSLGGRADLEHRARIDRCAAGLAAHAEALGVYEAVAGDDADREPRHAERLHGAAGVGLEVRNKRFDARLDGGVGGGGLRLRCSRDRARKRGGHNEAERSMEPNALGHGCNLSQDIRRLEDGSPDGSLQPR